MNKINHLYIILFVLFLSVLMLKAQTSNWNLIWDKNNENDVWKYKIYRDTTSTAVQNIGSVMNPDTIYNDNQIQKGIKYYYRITAVDYALNESNFSSEVSAAIPKISGLENSTLLSSNSTYDIDLDTVVYDPDHSNSQLQWTFSGNNQLSVQLNQSTNLLSITTPINWQSQETITLTVTDPDNFFDQANLLVMSTLSSNQPPVVSSIPDQTILEGQTLNSINLDDFVNDPDNPDDEMTWTVTGQQDLIVSVNQNRIATIVIPDTNWYGVETLTFKATDPGGLYGTESVLVEVININDAPVISDIPNKFVRKGEPFPNINLNAYVIDIDDPTHDLSWIYSGNQNLSVNLVQDSIASITVNDTSWIGSETIVFRASDPGGLFDEDSVKFSVGSQNNGIPFVSDILNQVINEGGNFALISLDDYVSDPNNSDDEISWTFINNIELLFSIDNNRILTVSTPDTDWYGEESVVFRATDPFGAYSEKTVQFEVINVNDKPFFSSVPEQVFTFYDSIIYVDFKQYIGDVDNSLNELLISYSGNNYLDIEVSNDKVAKVLTNNNPWNGIEVVSFRVTDPEQLFAEQSILFTKDFTNSENYNYISNNYFSNGNSIKIDWTTEKESQDFIEYGLTTTYGDSSQLENTYTKRHSIIITGLIPQKTYHYRIISTDKIGHMIYSPDNTFVTGGSGEINVFPIPFIAGKTPQNPGINFVNLPENSSIQIYNLLGEQILVVNNVTHHFSWNVKNNFDKPVQSGLHMYVIKNNENKKIQSGKLIIIR